MSTNTGNHSGGGRGGGRGSGRGGHGGHRGGSHQGDHSKPDSVGQGLRDAAFIETKVVAGGRVVEDERNDEVLVNPNRHRGNTPERIVHGATEAEARDAERRRVEAKRQGSAGAHRGGGGGSQRGGNGNAQGRGGAPHQGDNQQHGNNANSAKPHTHNNHRTNQQAPPPPPPAATQASEPVGEVPTEERVVVPYVAGSRPNIEEGIRKGTIVVGKLRVLSWGMGIAWVQCPGLGVDVEVHSVEARSGALAGDIVAVELTEDQSTWTDRRGNGPDGADDESAGGPTRQRFVAPTAPDAPKPTLPDGREVMYVVDDSNMAHAEKHPHANPVGAIYDALGTKPPAESIPADKKPRGVVVAVLERRFPVLHPARLLDQANNVPNNGHVQSNRFYKFRSYDKTFPFIAVFGYDIPPPLHDKLADVLPLIRIAVDSHGAPEQWVDGGRFPRGKVLMSLGMGGTAESETRAIAASNNIKDAPFTEEVEDSVFKEFVIPSSDRLKEMGRRDLRDEEFVCTIDPATARDLDDALSITKTSGGYRVGVHIADVSHFVPLNSPVDLEARDRCTSTYFVERVIPMLPHKLCEDYCSLNAGEDKFAFSCIFFMDNNGVITSEWFGQSIIRNRCRMAYEDAQRIIEGDTSGDSLVFHDEELKTSPWPKEELIKKVVASTTMLFELASKMRAARFESGALSLNKSKLKFKFDDINARVAPIGFSLDAIHEANWMVEQFMLLANIRVAEKIVEFLPQSALLRKHDSPDRKKLRAFKEAAAKHGIKVSINGSKGLNDSLAKYATDPRSDALRLMATYNMMLAKYISSGEDETDPVDHYALATPCYTHFTSPIRRYADLMVHRQLLLALEIEQHVKRNANQNNANATVDVSKLQYKPYYFTHYEVSEIADRCNQQKERARKCSDASLKMFFCLYLEAIRTRALVDKSVFPTQWVSAEVVRIKDGSFTIYATEISTDCEISFKSQNQHWRDECRYDKESNSVIINWGPGSGAGEGAEDQQEVIGLFHRVTASLLVTRDQGLMKLDMIIDVPWMRDRIAVGVRKVL